MKSEIKKIIIWILLFIFGSTVIRHFLLQEQEKYPIRIKES